MGLILDAKGNKEPEKVKIADAALWDRYRLVGKLLKRASDIYNEARAAHETGQPLMREVNGVSSPVAPQEFMGDIRRLEHEAMKTLDGVLWDLVGPRVLAAMGNLHAAQKADLEKSMEEWAEKALARRGWDMQCKKCGGEGSNRSAFGVHVCCDCGGSGTTRKTPENGAG